MKADLCLSVFICGFVHVLVAAVLHPLDSFWILDSGFLHSSFTSLTAGIIARCDNMPLMAGFPLKNEPHRRYNPLNGTWVLERVVAAMGFVLERESSHQRHVIT